jgi:hypothetical protein
MSTLEVLHRRIADLKRVRLEEAESYVKSIAKQIGAADVGSVAQAIEYLLASRKPCKAKDIARLLKAGPVPAVPATSLEPPVAAGAEDDGEPPRPAKEPDAETRRDTRFRFEQWAKNQKCEANLISAVHGVSMALVAKAEGIPPSMGQSPFALARGQMFEGRLFKNGAERLIPELARQGVLPAAAATFRDFRLRHHGGPHRTLDDARTATDGLLRDIANGKAGKTPVIVAGATIRIPGGGMLPEAILVVDALVARTDLTPPQVVVGEVKTYPDRAGYTDAKELAVARAQAGVYVQGLKLVIQDLGLADAITVATRGFLVLSRPGFNAPSVRSDEDLEFQASRADRGFARLRKAAAALPQSRPPDVIAAIRAAETKYSEGCLSFCDLAPACWKKAIDTGNLAVLGEDVARWVGLVGLPRTLELLDGEAPKNIAEEDLARRIEEARLPEVDA